jgi:hypothetical protein
MATAPQAASAATSAEPALVAAAVVEQPKPAVAPAAAAAPVTAVAQEQTLPNPFVNEQASQNSVPAADATKKVAWRRGGVSRPATSKI